MTAALHHKAAVFGFVGKSTLKQKLTIYTKLSEIFAG